MRSGNVGVPVTSTSSLNVTATLMVSPAKYSPPEGGDATSTPVTYGTSPGNTARSTNDRP